MGRTHRKRAPWSSLPFVRFAGGGFPDATSAGTPRPLNPTHGGALNRRVHRLVDLVGFARGDERLTGGFTLKPLPPTALIRLVRIPTQAAARRKAMPAPTMKRMPPPTIMTMCLGWRVPPSTALARSVPISEVWPTRESCRLKPSTRRNPPEPRGQTIPIILFIKREVARSGMNRAMSGWTTPTK